MMIETHKIRLKYFSILFSFIGHIKELSGWMEKWKQKMDNMINGENLGFLLDKFARNWSL